MKSIISKTCAVIAVAATLLSFSTSSPTGGEGFEIFLNGKKVLQQFGKDMNTVKTLELDQSSPRDKLTIRYYHCGKIGKNRYVTIKDAQDRQIKVWRYKDPQTASGEMSCHVQDILSLKKGNNNIFKLYYSSSELPEGRQLAAVSFGGSSAMTRK